MSNPSILITGAAGFIGFHLSRRLASEGYQVLGIDNMNEYYDVNLKRSRLQILKSLPNFSFTEVDLRDKAGVNDLVASNKVSYVVNLAAQAGVRYSLTHPDAYIESNIQGFLSVLEACRHNKVAHLIYASSSSVYGANKKIPFSVHHNVDHPMSLYAASKKSNELMAHSYSALFQLPTTGLRFFNAYGTYGRPDMALFIFTKAILEGQPIDVFNYGDMKRDFTYIDDIVEIIVRLIPKVASPDPKWNAVEPDPATSFAPYRVYNIGNSSPVPLMDYISLIEKKLGKKAIKNMLPIREGEVTETCADVSDVVNAVGHKPSTPLETGVGNFIDWYLSYYGIKNN